ncbi:GNAT family N-acetyltransferase [Salinicoccus sp. HZC-1]|uniref:GNAT family N-acetyltransferase n=1 Tax=Salinicoccus sp. HZC-1 TaxID=3385497 RepID=UPI00398B2B70
MKLRPLEETDLEFIHGLANDYSIMSYWFEEPYNSLAKLKEAYQNNNSNESARRFIIENESDLVGIVDLDFIDFKHRNCEIMIIIKPEFSGNGFAKFAFKEATKYAFEVLNMHKVYLYVDTENEKAVKIYEKQGFKTEGVLREHFYAKGKYRDAAFMSILKSEWIEKE